MNTKRVACRMCSGTGRVTKHRHDPEDQKLVPTGVVSCTFCHGEGYTAVPKDIHDLAADITRLQLEIRALWDYVRRIKA
jgi:hypothetical protein